MFSVVRTFTVFSESMTDLSQVVRQKESAQTVIGMEAFDASNTISLGDHIELSPPKVYLPNIYVKKDKY